MKKHSLSIIAVLVAVALSAFTIDNHKPANATQRLLYWYHIDGSGNIGSQVASGVPSYKDNVLSEVGCPDGYGVDCARGYTSTKVFGTTAPAPDSDDDHIMVFQ